MKLSNIAFLYTFIKLHDFKIYNPVLIKPLDNFINYPKNNKINLH
jgi:hypothetical protein